MVVLIEFITITYFRSCVSIQAIYALLAMFPNATLTLKYKLFPLHKNYTVCNTDLCTMNMMVGEEALREFQDSVLLV